MGQKREREEPRERYSKLPSEEESYWKELGETLAGIDDPGERRLLAENSLEGAGVPAATDAASSRIIEALLPAASTPALAAFTRACVDGENLGLMCTSGPFGSHVLEKCLTGLAGRAASAGDEDFTAIEEALNAVTDAAAASLYEMATSKYGSFVARRLLCVLAGRDVAPPPGKKPQEKPPGDEPSQQQQQAQQQQQQGPRGGGALAAKLRSGGEAEGSAAGGLPTGADYPALLDRLAAVVLGDEWSGEEMSRLATDTFAGPFLQALLRACTHNQKLQQRLLLQVLGGSGSKGVESVTVERCHALMQDRQGSHLMEAVFTSAPDDYFAKLTTLCFKGHLLNLAQHACANFAVQAALAALRKPQQLKRMFEDLRPSFGQLLRSRRSGVIAALLAAAGRLGAQEAEAAAALWAAAGEGGGGGPPLQALLTLDTTTQLGSGGRLSTLGCAMLGTVLCLPPAACKQWGDAVAALPPGQLRHVAKDPGGCRVLEAYLEGPGAPSKKRKALLQGLAGSWGEVAMGGSGNNFVEKCYALGEAPEKEAIALELAAAEPRLVATHRGPLLLRRCHVDAFKKGSDCWQARVQAADAARREFEDLFGEAEAAEGGDAAAAAAAAQGSEVEEEAGGEAAATVEAEEKEEEEEGGDQPEPEKKKKKKNYGTKKARKRAAAEAAAAAKAAAKAAAPAQQQEAEQQQPPKKKKKKAAAPGEQQAVEGGADAAPPAGKKAKKGKQKKGKAAA
ncbi:Pumilio 23 [Micractinium conductrix]|uniref:Pumilio 23 n=1 Tax=Micractinium conductrix TaxID=554055 RepID=A0A2P6UZG9_9CHLO|nr:Pumilio 23 [Micractinium conductrix]|eukprot:PSC67230.1 Pumilio 23 [Micractinium conductrix]